MIKNGFLLIISILLYNCQPMKGQDMNMHYDNYSLHDTVIGGYHNIYIKNNTDSILLEKYEALDFHLSPEGVCLRDEIMGTPRYHSYIAVTVKDSVIFVLHAFGGVVSLQTYCWQNDTVHKSNEYFVEHHYVISVANGGDVAYNAGFLWVDNDLYMHIYGGQLFGGKVDNMYKFSFVYEDILSCNSNHSTDGIFNFPQVSDKMSKINFEKPDKLIMVFHLNDWGREYYERDKNALETYAKDDKKLKGRVEIYEQYLQKPYYYRLMSNDEKQRSQQLSEMRINNLEGYSLFSESLYDKPDSVKMLAALQYIEEVLDLYGTEADAPPVTLLGDITTTRNNTSFFFYRDKNQHLKILSYMHYSALWSIAGFNPEKTEPRQLWFRAGDKLKN